MPNELDHATQAALADLRHHAGFLALLKILERSEADALDAVESESDQDELLRQMRFWQFVRKVRRWLEGTPATVGAELDTLRRDGLLGPDAPTSRGDAWRRRYAAVTATPAEDDADETYDPASI